MKLRLLTVAVFAGLTTGCSSMMQSSEFSGFEEDLKTGNSEALLETVESKAEDDLLWSMQAGAVLRLEQSYDRSNFHLDNAEQLMKEEDTEGGVSEAVDVGGSMVLNDAFMDYEQSHYDGVMTNTYKALNFMALGDMDSARVEFNRAEDRQRRAAQYFSEEIKEKKEDAEGNDAMVNQSMNAIQKDIPDMSGWKAYEGYINPYTSYMNAIFLLNNAQDRSDYAKAENSLKRIYDMTKNPSVKVDWQMAKDLAKGAKSASMKDAVWVVYENGLSTVKEEKRLDLPVFLVPGSVSKNVQYVGIAFPQMKDREVATQNVKVDGHQTVVVADMDKIIKAEFAEEFPYIIGREITRTVLKTIAQKQLNDQDEGLGAIAAIAQFATTGADIRMQTTLPKEIQVTRFNRVGSDVVIEGFGEPIKVKLEGENNMVYIKSVSPTSLPKIDVIKLK